MLTILMLDVLLLASLMLTPLFGPAWFSLVLLMLLFGIPLLTLRSSVAAVSGLRQAAGHTTGAAAVRLAAGGSFTLLGCLAILEYFQGRPPAGVAAQLGLIYCAVQVVRLVGAQAVNLVLALGAPLYCKKGGDWKWTLLTLASSLLALWAIHRPKTRLSLGPEVLATVQEGFQSEQFILVAYCLVSFSYALTLGGTLQFFLQKSFSRPQ